MKTFLAFAAATMLLVTTAYAQPKIEIKGGDTYDWGNVSDVSKPLAGQVEIKNVGNKELVIVRTKPACGCTSDALERSNIKPGETSTLKFTVNPGSAGGQLMKSITITTNVQPDSVKILYLKANIIHGVQVEPQFVSFFPLYTGKEAKSTAKVRNNGSTPLKILEITSNNGVITDKKAPFTIPANSEMELPLRVIGPAQQGPFYGALLLKTDNPQYQLLEVRSYGDTKAAPAETTPSSPAYLPSGGQ
jgi:Protein of unknown function (DUF1573)